MTRNTQTHEWTRGYILEVAGFTVQTSTPLLFQNFQIRIRVRKFFEFENPTSAQTPVAIDRSVRNLYMSLLRNDQADSCCCQNWKLTPCSLSHRFLTPDSGPKKNTESFQSRLLLHGQLATSDTHVAQRWVWTGSGLDILQNTCDFFESGLDLDIYFGKNWIKTGSGYSFDLYNEISMRVIQDVTNDAWWYRNVLVFIFTKKSKLFCQYVVHLSQSMIIHVTLS